MYRSKNRLVLNQSCISTVSALPVRALCVPAVFAMLFGMLLVSHASAAPPDAGSATRPNIVLIMCDDMGWSDIGCYGGEIETPNLDRLARGGMRFRTFYNNAKCEHTRASLLTGHWWHHVGASASVHYSAPTFGERMREKGYATLMTGKWHAGQTPFLRGFDRYYGLTDGCCNFWNPGHARDGEAEPAKKKVRRWADDDQTFLPFTPPSKDFYTTDAFTDRAIEYLQDHGRKNEQDVSSGQKTPSDLSNRDNSNSGIPKGGAAKPFLLYLAYTAPHYPLHASRADVEKYRGKYRQIGWSKLREQRFARQQQLGVLPANTTLSPEDSLTVDWDSLSDADKDQWDLRMATYAAMIDRMDRNIGRLLGAIDDTGQANNTVVFFLSDNGACSDSRDRSTVSGAMPWEVTSYLTQGQPWANASNTPFRKYKTTDYEGGTRTPMIAYWPGVIQAGSFTDHVGHLVDFVPTMLELSGDSSAAKLPGHSLVPALKGQASERPWPMYWQFGNAKAIRDSRYKLVKYGGSDWELYDLLQDPVELMDLAAEKQEVADRLIKSWEDWWAKK